MEDFVTISGCSGGGKSTLLAELRRRGFPTIDEPGRRIVVEELKRNGRALPWVDAVAFARLAIEVSLADRAAAEASAPWVFFDRGLIDAAAALEHLTGERVIESLGSRSAIAHVPYSQAYAPGFDDMRRRKPVVDKLASVTGFRPSISLKRIIQLTAAAEILVGD